MKFDKSLHGALDNSAQFYLEGICRLFESIFVIVCDRADEVDLYVFVIVQHNVACKEVFEPVQDDSVDTGFLDVLDEERRNRCQEAVGERLLIHIVQNLLGGEVEAIEEFLLQLGRQLVFQAVAYQQFA